jgi:hypothetical protein
MKTSVVFLLFVSAAGHTQKAGAQSPGTFTATGNMTAPRSWHTATLLPDGKVFIAGGFAVSGEGTSRAAASAELYDPRTGRFSGKGGNVHSF